VTVKWRCVGKNSGFCTFFFVRLSVRWVVPLCVC